LPAAVTRPVVKEPSGQLGLRNKTL